MTIHIMIDLETMGTSSNAPVVAIGAVVFGVDTFFQVDGTDDGKFYKTIDLRSSARFGQTDASTVLWWMDQDPEARRHVTEATLSLPAVLMEYSNWVFSQVLGDADKVSEVCMWGNGAAFDNVVLRNAYLACGMSPPWLFRGDRCYRTLRNMFPDIAADEFVGTPHVAVDDAVHQARHAAKILTQLTWGVAALPGTGPGYHG